MQSEYLLFNLVVFCFPMLGMVLAGKWKSFSFRALTFMPVIALAFIVWDALVVGSWWSFNPAYVLGFRLFGLPFEEWLFFFTVPFACLVVWEWLRDFSDEVVIGKRAGYVIVAALFFAGVSFLFTGRMYTGVAAVLSGVLLGADMRWWGLSVRKNAVVFVGIVIVLLIIFDGYLTARPVVLYNPEVKLSIQLFSIPAEDFLYGWVLVFSNVVGYEVRKKLRMVNFV